MKNDYKPYLVSLLNYLDNPAEQYTKETEFNRARLLQIRPGEILRWMNIHTFGMPHPPQDANPTLAHSSSIAYWKKALSSYMPNKHHPWNPETNFGNPTRSWEINDLVARVKKKEVQQQGVPSQARHPLEEGEF